MIGRAAITVDYERGKVSPCSSMTARRSARKAEHDYDPTDRVDAQNFLQRHARKAKW